MARRQSQGFIFLEPLSLLTTTSHRHLSFSIIIWLLRMRRRTLQGFEAHRLLHRYFKMVQSCLLDLNNFLLHLQITASIKNGCPWLLNALIIKRRLDLLPSRRLALLLLWLQNLHPGISQFRQGPSRLVRSQARLLTKWISKLRLWCCTWHEEFDIFVWWTQF